VRGLLIGRFQPFHSGHLALVRQIRAARPNDPLLLGIGSAQASFTWKNPFTAGERVEMIVAAIEDAGVDRVLPVPVPDIDRHALWVRHVESLLPPFDRLYTNNPLTRLLFDAAKYPVESPALVDRARFEGERIRAKLASGTGWEPLVPPAVARYLLAIGAPARLALLREHDGPSPGVAPP
jgi:nicotinamide-nucleotide adenylyltransferase